MNCRQLSICWHALPNWKPKSKPCNPANNIIHLKIIGSEYYFRSFLFLLRKITMLRRLPILLLLFFGLVVPASAHANLVRSEPATNARLTTSPDEIRLYFTEPIEAQFSRIAIWNSQGAVLDMPASQVDPDDDKQLILIPGAMADGVYTVTWRVVSQTDGHLTEGVFPLTIGSAMGVVESLSSLANETIPLHSVIIRWLNMLSLAWFVGSVGFWLFIWQPTLPDGHPETEQQMNRVIILGWIVVGITSALMLLLQASIVSGTGLLQSFNAVPQVLTGTRFGQLWLGRGLLWLICGGLLLFWRDKTLWTYRLLLILGSGILITQSLFSHASGTVDAAPAVLADWLHLVAMSIWIGGLIQFVVVIGAMRQILGVLSVMVARFSNMARLSVAMLVITGTYAAWLHIGSLDGFISTQYGRVMTVKLLLFLLLLVIGAVNLLLTSRGLQSGHVIWSVRLRNLVRLEITLAIVILVAVGVMTAIASARITLASREISELAPPSSTYFDMAQADNLMIHLTVEPGTVGDNTFYVDLFNAETNEVIQDASLIRLRFEAEGADVGESELRPELQESGRYVTEGANLSLAGDWRIRMTVQRPKQYDAVVDFETTINIGQPPIIPDFDPAPPQQPRAFALILTGISGALMAGFALVRTRPIRLNAQTVLTIVFLAGSIVILQSGLQLFVPQPVAVNPPEITDETPIQMATSAALDRPYLLTQGGTVLKPDGASWSAIAFDEPIRDMYAQAADTLWAATDKGLFRYIENTWMQEDATPSNWLTETHGYLFALGTGQIFRMSAGGIETDERLLDVPETEVAASQLEMLGSHSHVLLNGDAAYVTSDLGLSWQPLDAPAAIRRIAIDGDGHLLALTDTELLRWRWTEQAWYTLDTLPTTVPIDDLVAFITGDIYVVAQGQVYHWQNPAWALLEFDSNAYIVDMEFQYPATLWALDAGQARLWKLIGGNSEWETISINVSE
jgi:copper transport protein